MTYWKYLHSNLISYNKKCETTNYEASGVLTMTASHSITPAPITKIKELGDLPRKV